MTPRQLRTFLAVARARSFVRASKAVHLAQSSVSDQIQALESDLGTPLFVRARHGVTLTAAGTALVPYAEQMLALEDDARIAIRDAMAGQERLVVGALGTIAAARLPALLTHFSQLHPATGLHMKVAGTGDLLAAVAVGEMDVAFCFDNGDADTRLLGRTVAAEPVVLIAPPGTGKPQEKPFIVTEPGCVYRHISDAALAAVALPYGSIIEVGSIAAMVGMVARGMGVALVPRMAAEDLLASGDVVSLPWGHPLPDARLRMIWRRRRVQTNALKAFLELFPGGVG